MVSILFGFVCLCHGTRYLFRRLYAVVHYSDILKYFRLSFTQPAGQYCPTYVDIPKIVNGLGSVISVSSASDFLCINDICNSYLFIYLFGHINVSTRGAPDIYGPHGRQVKPPNVL